MILGECVEGVSDGLGAVETLRREVDTIKVKYVEMNNLRTR